MTIPGGDDPQRAMVRMEKSIRVAAARASILRHYSQQFEAVASAKRDVDSCREEQAQAKRAQDKVADLVDDLRTMTRAQVHAWPELAGYRKKLDAATRPEEQQRWQDEITEVQVEIDRRNGRIAEAQVRLSRAEEFLNDMILDLKECRKNHPLDTRCGPRGGVGIERPDGKCAGWDDWRNADGLYC